mgnify:CR=1 FL=1
MRIYAVLIGKNLYKVRGRVNSIGWLEWKRGDNSGLSRPSSFCLWSDRKQRFPGIEDYKEGKS